MKQIALIVFMFYGIFTFGQDQTQAQQEESKSESKKLFSFGISTGYKTFLGDNFLAETYKNELPLCIDARFNIYKNFGAGLYYSFNNASVETTKFVGNSNEGSFKEWGFYTAYFIPINSKFTFVPRIGIATFSMKNKLRDAYFNGSYDYYTEGTTYFIAPELHYFVTPAISLLLNVEYGYISLPNVSASSALNTNYSSASELFLGIGVNVWL